MPKSLLVLLVDDLKCTIVIVHGCKHFEYVWIFVQQVRVVYIVFKKKSNWSRGRYYLFLLHQFFGTFYYLHQNNFCRYHCFV